MGLFRRRPTFQLTGLAATPDGLYDGSFVVACARWWNHEVESRRELMAMGHRPFATEDVRALCGVAQPENRRAFEVMASAVSIPGRFSTAVLNLAYAFALVIDAAATQIHEPEEAAATWVQARAFTEDDLTELHRHYSKEGWALEYETWAPFWMAAATAFDGPVGEKLVASARAAFDDQVDRWSAAEGIDLRRSIGSPDWALIKYQDDDRPILPNFVELLFEWGGRLRLGERFLAEGDDLADHRFAADDGSFGFIDHLYEEAFERYAEVASQEPPPIPDDVELAARMGTAWLAHDLDQRGRLAVSTATIRAYLWRTVEGGPVDFLEPKLTESVGRARTVGDDRSEHEARGVTYYYAASQCMVDDVHTRVGSIGGLMNGPRSYERALIDTTNDFEENGFALDEDTKRQAFNFGICLADVERALGDREHTTYLTV